MAAFLCADYRSRAWSPAGVVVEMPWRWSLVLRGGFSEPGGKGGRSYADESHEQQTGSRMCVRVVYSTGLRACAAATKRSPMSLELSTEWTVRGGGRGPSFEGIPLEEAFDCEHGCLGLKNSVVAGSAYASSFQSDSNDNNCGELWV